MIKGKRVNLMPLERENIDLFLKWFNDPEILQYLTVFKPMTRDMEEEWFDALKHRENAIYFSIQITTDNNSKKIIGNCAIQNIDGKDRSSTIGITIGEKNYQNKGYGTEAMELLVKYGFDILNLNRIGLSVYDFNIRAIRAYEKAGFIEEGIKRQARYYNGKYHDEIIMAILREDWLKKKKQ
jgi:RimJ/RimL family protein N-acetyltransferase